jgi:hypothetical protein
MQEKILQLNPSFPHSVLLQAQIQKCYFLIKAGGSPESERMLALFTEIDFKFIGAFEAEVFKRVQKEALSLLALVLGGELVRPD